jgi:hypothetical protein
VAGLSRVAFDADSRQLSCFETADWHFVEREHRPAFAATPRRGENCGGRDLVRVNAAPRARRLRRVRCCAVRFV